MQKGLKQKLHPNYIKLQVFLTHFIGALPRKMLMKRFSCILILMEVILVMKKRILSYLCVQFVLTSHPAYFDSNTFLIVFVNSKTKSSISF